MGQGVWREGRAIVKHFKVEKVGENLSVSMELERGVRGGVFCKLVISGEVGEVYAGYVGEMRDMLKVGVEMMELDLEVGG